MDVRRAREIVIGAAVQVAKTKGEASEGAYEGPKVIEVLMLGCAPRFFSSLENDAHRRGDVCSMIFQAGDHHGGSACSRSRHRVLNAAN